MCHPTRTDPSRPVPSRRRLDAPRRNGKGAVNSTHPTRPPPPQRINKPEQTAECPRSRTFPHFTPPPPPPPPLSLASPSSHSPHLLPPPPPPPRAPRYLRRRKRHSDLREVCCSSRRNLGARVFCSPARARRELRGAVPAECDGRLAAVASHLVTVQSFRQGDIMSFRSIARDVRDGFGSLSRRSFDVTIASLYGLTGHHRGKGQSSLEDLHEPAPILPESRWASLPPELLQDVIRRLEADESTWPSRKHVVCFAAVCRTWRDMCKEIVLSPEFSGKLTFRVSLKQPGPRDGMIQCFIKRNKSKSTYQLYLCLTNVVTAESGKFLLSARRNRKASCTEYAISMDGANTSRSNRTYIGKLRSNFLGTKFLIYDTQPPYNGAVIPPVGRSSRRFNSTKVSPKVPPVSYNIAQVTYELNVLGTRGPRRMRCIMHSVPASSVEPGGIVPGQPEQIVPRALGDSFRSITSFSQSFRSSTTFSKSIMDQSMDFNSARFSEISGGMTDGDGEGEVKDRPLVLRNKPPRWHEQLQCWCLNFRGRVTIASVKNFQLIAASSPPPAGAPTPSQPGPVDPDKVILQFGKVARDMFTMDYRYPISAFQAFAICLSSFDTKLACE